MLKHIIQKGYNRIILIVLYRRHSAFEYRYMYYSPYETTWKYSQSCWHHMYLGISSLHCLINKNIGHPKLMYFVAINRYEVHPWMWFWITPDAIIYPYHANRGFQCNVLGFFIYFKYIPNIQGNIYLEEIVT